MISAGFSILRRGCSSRYRFLVGASLVAHHPIANPAQQAEESQCNHQPDRFHGPSPQDAVIDVECDDFSITHRENDRKKNGCDDACHDPSRNPTCWPPPGNPPRNRAHDHEAGQKKYQSKKERSEGDDCEPCKCRTHPAAHCGLVAAEIGMARRAYHHCDGEQYPKRYAREEDCSDIADSL